jgi:hypothetical protein
MFSVPEENPKRSLMNGAVYCEHTRLKLDSTSSYLVCMDHTGLHIRRECLLKGLCILH